ncbi:hypothetical protein LINPERPRIM_LOCUS41064 [Linum perenne]
MAITDHEDSDDGQITQDQKMKIAQKDNEWHMDSGCSHHMTGNSKLFSSLTLKKGGITLDIFW